MTDAVAVVNNIFSQLTKITGKKDATVQQYKKLAKKILGQIEDFTKSKQRREAIKRNSDSINSLGKLTNRQFEELLDEVIPILQPQAMSNPQPNLKAVLADASSNSSRKSGKLNSMTVNMESIRGKMETIDEIYEKFVAKGSDILITCTNGHKMIPISDTMEPTPQSPARPSLGKLDSKNKRLSAIKNLKNKKQGYYCSNCSAFLDSDSNSYYDSWICQQCKTRFCQQCYQQKCQRKKEKIVSRKQKSQAHKRLFSYQLAMSREPRCENDHILEVTSYKDLIKQHNEYKNGFECHQCKGIFMKKDSYHCAFCWWDMCEKCYEMECTYGVSSLAAFDDDDDDEDDDRDDSKLDDDIDEHANKERRRGSIVFRPMGDSSDDDFYSGSSDSGSGSGSGSVKKKHEKQKSKNKNKNKGKNKNQTTAALNMFAVSTTTLVAQTIMCDKGHGLVRVNLKQLIAENSKLYNMDSGFLCDICKVGINQGSSQHCSKCQYNICSLCYLDIIENKKGVKDIVVRCDNNHRLLYKSKKQMKEMESESYKCNLCQKTYNDEAAYYCRVRVCVCVYVYLILGCFSSVTVAHFCFFCCGVMFVLDCSRVFAVAMFFG